MAEVITISSEEDLWELLRRCLSPDGPLEIERVRIRGWTPHLLYFPDAPVGHSISPSIARAVAGYHSSLSRSYAYVVYGKADGRQLSSEDRAVLDLQMLVIDGSNGLDVIGDALDRLTDAVVHKLTGRQVTYIIAFFLLLNFSATVVKDWLSAEYAEKAKVAEIQEQIDLSEQETKRMQMLVDALNLHPGLKPVSDITAEGRAPLVRGVLSQGRGKIFGTEISQSQASVIVSREKEKGVGQRFDGRFEVVEIDVENPEGFMGTLRDIKSQKEIRVAINRGELTEADVRVLFTALEEKSAVDALVNAWVVGGKISYAAVVRADRPDKP